jgi:DNA replication and repair protein RecF
MYLENLHLVNFKNLSQAEFSFSQGINCIIGENGVGKTNILDAIHYLCLCKSYFNPVDTQNIMHEEDFAVIQGDFDLEGIKDEIYCGIQRNKYKIFKRNKKEYGRLADHIGLLPVVMISPEDYGLITEGSDERRKFLNSVISQYDRLYLDDIIEYNRILVQRNKLLKSSYTPDTGEEMLQVYDIKMAEHGKRIFEKRTDFAKRLVPIFKGYYKLIAPEHEEVDLIYQSQLAAGDFVEMLTRFRGKDFIMQYTTAGIHKDDIILNLNGHHMKKTASQGQQKTFLVSLKFAQFDFIRERNNIMPILLLDDVFDKFDDNRVRQIMKIVAGRNFGQIFITHTDEHKMRSILGEVAADYRIFRVSRDGIMSA